MHRYKVRRMENVWYGMVWQNIISVWSSQTKPSPNQDKLRLNHKQLLTPTSMNFRTMKFGSKVQKNFVLNVPNKIVIKPIL